MARPTRAASSPWISVLALIAASTVLSCGGGGNGGGTGGGNPPSAPTGLTATAGDKQVSLTWSASSGAASYNVKRSTTTGGPYAQAANTVVTNDTERQPCRWHEVLLRRLGCKRERGEREF